MSFQDLFNSYLTTIPCFEHVGILPLIPPPMQTTMPCISSGVMGGKDFSSVVGMFPFYRRD